MQIRGHRQSPPQAFTLHAVLISSSIFFVVAAGLISSHLFGLQMCQITQAKLSAQDQSRKLLNLLMSDVRAAQSLQIAQGSGATFLEIGPNRPQQGNSLLLYPSAANTNQYIRYYVDPSDNKLKRLTDGGGIPKIIVPAVSNSVVFTAERFDGTILTNAENQCVIGVNLQFSQLQFPMLDIGPGHYYASFQFQTKIARRALE